jgi:hypothetical protein
MFDAKTNGSLPEFAAYQIEIELLIILPLDKSGTLKVIVTLKVHQFDSAICSHHSLHQCWTLLLGFCGYSKRTRCFHV